MSERLSLSPPDARPSRATLFLRALWIVGLAAFAALFVYTARKGIDPVVHDRYTRNIRAIEALDAQLNGEVMLSRQSLVNHYDDIVRTLTSLESIHRDLEAVPPFLGTRERGEIAGLVKASAKKLGEKSGSIETFKSENAVLRNSVRYFPVGALELRDRLAAESGAERVARTVNELLCTVLRFNTQPSDILRERAKKELVELDGVSLGREDQEDLDIVVVHAKTVLDRRDRVDDLTNQIVAVPTRPQIEALDASYSRSYQAALRASDQRRVALFILALAVLGLVSTDIIIHLRKVARVSRETSAKLAVANEALKREKEREKELHDLKSRFVSMTSHEFRTPLSVILSSTELLEAYSERWSAAKKSDHFSRIKEAVRGMTDLLNGILVIGKSEMGRLEIAPSRLDLERYCRELVDMTMPTIGKDHELETKIADDFGEVWADEKLLNHILTNLLSNAVKYSPEGGVIRFEAWRDGDEACFVVADEGIGISEPDVTRLFESFHRGSNVGEIPGTGLGLTVVKRSVDAHGGTLDLKTKEGEGTTFTVRIRVAEPEKEAVRRADSTDSVDA